MIISTLLTIVISHFFMQHKEMVLKHVAERYIIFGIQVMMKQTDVIHTAFELALTNSNFATVFTKTKFAAWHLQDKDYRLPPKNDKPPALQRSNTMPSGKSGIREDFMKRRLGTTTTIGQGIPAARTVDPDMEF